MSKAFTCLKVGKSLLNKLLNYPAHTSSSQNRGKWVYAEIVSRSYKAQSCLVREFYDHISQCQLWMGGTTMAKMSSICWAGGVGWSRMCCAWSASPPTGEEFYPQPLNIYGSKCSCTGASLSAHSHSKTPQDFTSWVLFMLQRGDATPNASWFVLNTWAEWNRCGGALLTLHWTSGPEAPDNSMNPRRFWGDVNVGFSHLEQPWANYCKSKGKDGDARSKLQHPDGNSTWK